MLPTMALSPWLWKAYIAGCCSILLRRRNDTIPFHGRWGVARREAKPCWGTERGCGRNLRRWKMKRDQRESCSRRGRRAHHRRCCELSRREGRGAIFSGQRRLVKIAEEEQETEVEKGLRRWWETPCIGELGNFLETEREKA